MEPSPQGTFIDAALKLVLDMVEAWFIRPRVIQYIYCNFQDHYGLWRAVCSSYRVSVHLRCTILFVSDHDHLTWCSRSSRIDGDYVVVADGLRETELKRFLDV